MSERRGADSRVDMGADAGAADAGADDAHRRRPMTPFQERLARMTVQVMAGLNLVAFRLSDGRVGGHVPSGARCSRGWVSCRAGIGV